MPASMPVEAPGDRLMNQHHPMGGLSSHPTSPKSPLRMAHRIDTEIEETEAAPAYSLVSGSVLSPVTEIEHEDDEVKREEDEQPSEPPKPTTPKATYTLVEDHSLVSPVSPQTGTSERERSVEEVGPARKRE